MNLVNARLSVLSHASLSVGCAVAGYLYLVRVVRPAPVGSFCPQAGLSAYQCGSYQVIVATPFFVIVGALAGLWLAWVLWRSSAVPGRRGAASRLDLFAGLTLLVMLAWVLSLHPGMMWNGWDSLGWTKVLVFPLAAVLARLAVGMTPQLRMRGAYILALGLPVAVAGLGYASARIFQLPPVGHSCPSFAQPQACVYHPLIGTGAPWAILGLLVGLWLVRAIASARSGTPHWGVTWAEAAIATPVLAAVIAWALIVGPDQAGQGYVGRFILAACLAALLRLALGAILPHELSTARGPHHHPNPAA